MASRETRGYNPALLREVRIIKTSSKKRHFLPMQYSELNVRMKIWPCDAAGDA